MSHVNSGSCEKCQQIFDTFPGFHQGLRNWFKMVQKQIPTFHCAEAGRGHIEQEKDYAKGASRAWWGESAHNFNCAFDSFFLIDGKYNLDESNYERVARLLPSSITWYGSATARFYERPHFEISNFRELKARGELKLVEDFHDSKHI